MATPENPYESPAMIEAEPASRVVVRQRGSGGVVPLILLGVVSVAMLLGGATGITGGMGLRLVLMVGIPAIVIAVRLWVGAQGDQSET